MENRDLRKEAKERSVYLWQIAEALGISEPTMTRLLRHELSPGKKAEIRSIIEKLAKEAT